MRFVVLVSACSLLVSLTHAADIDVVGLFPGKAVLVIDGALPKTYSIGNTIADGIRLIEISDDSATFENHGKRETIMLGVHVNHHAASLGNGKAILRINDQGHFITQGEINGSTLSMLVDTGATAVSLPASEAKRLGIDYKKNGRFTYVHTANGVAQVHRITLDTVKVGDIELHEVDAIVHEDSLPIVLLGMSFLNRVDIRYEGEQMTLTKRY